MMPGQPQPYPPQYKPQPTTDGKATASLILGIVGCVGCFALTGIPAIILGFMARGSIARSGGARGGDGLAIGGIVTGFISLVFSAILVLAFIPLMIGAKEGFQKAQIETAKTSLMTIQAVALTWQVDHPGDCPTPARLKTESFLSPSSDLNDPWRTPYAIDCAGGTVTAVSYGPDKKAGTSDDIRYP